MKGSEGHLRLLFFFLLTIAKWSFKVIEDNMSPNTPFYFPNLSSLHIDQCFTVGQLAVGFLYSHIQLSLSLALSPDCHLMALMHLNVAKKKGSQALLHSSDSFFSFNFNFYFKRSNKYGQLTIILRNHINDLQNVCASSNCRALSFDSISESLERPLMGLNCCCFFLWIAFLHVLTRYSHLIQVKCKINARMLIYAYI